MASPDNTQALIAAFAFGIVVNAASAAVFLYIKGHGSSIMRDGLRLVLVTFFTTSALWAQTDFISTLIDTNSTSGCQVAIVFASIFDQLARISLEQALLWGINHGAQKATAIQTLLPQGVIVLRFILGGVFVGVQRPQTNSVCVTSTKILPLGAIILAIDAILIAFLLAQAIMTGLLNDLQGGSPGAVRSKALVLSIAGLGIWTATSIPMLLGIKSIALIARTAVPAGGLSILIGILTLFKDSLTTSSEATSNSSPEAPSPRGFGISRDLQSRDIGTADSSYPPSRYEDVKFGAMTTISTAPKQSKPGSGLPFIWGPGNDQANIGMGGLPVQGQLFPPTRSQTAPVITETKAKKKPILKKGGKLTISNPIFDASQEDNPLDKITTVDLATAAKNEKERRDMGQLPLSVSLQGPRRIPHPSNVNLSTEDLIKREQSLKRKEVGSKRVSKETYQSSLEPHTGFTPTGTSTSAQLSPGVEEIRRRSPRQVSQPFQQETSPVTPEKPQALSSQTESSYSPQHHPEIDASSANDAAIVSQVQFSEKDSTSSSQSPRLVQRSISSASAGGAIVGSSAIPDARNMTEVPLPLAPRKNQSLVQRSASTPSRSIAPLQRQNTTGSHMSSKEMASRLTILPRENSVKSNIRPSRQGPRSPSKEPAAARQQRLKTGLPSNPRAPYTKGLNQDQTVMLINSIQYNDPEAVQDVVGNVKGKQPSNSSEDLRPRALSVVHRPRPIPRKPEIDRALFPAEDSPNLHEHKRSLSGGSLRSKRSIFQSVPGSPGQLPPLPPLPKSAGNALRPHPNDTRSMTWDEKMKMFYPASLSDPKGTKSVRRRSSSLPELPTIPTVYSGQQLASQESVLPTPGRDPRESAKERSMEDDVSETDEALDETFVAPNVSKFSVTTYQSTAAPVQSWMARPLTHARTSTDGAKRRSSPILPAEHLDSPSAVSETRSRDDETATNWGSIHSPAQPVNIQRARAVEVSPAPKAEPCPSDGIEFDVDTSSLGDHDDGKETMTVMLDPSLERSLSTTSASRTGQAPPRREKQGTSWHRRVGEKCPTFSTRRHTVKPRKVPPPAPLLLYRSNTVSMKVQAEPSPLESPDDALEMIQAQLKKLEGSNRDSTSSEQQKQRMTLLDNLEAEMGQQQNHWHQIRHDLGTRDSLSTVQASPNPEAYHEGAKKSWSAEKPLRDSTADRRASRGTKPISRASDEGLDLGSQASSSSAYASQWRQRSPGMDMDRSDVQPDLMHQTQATSNLLSVSMAKSQMGSPTPPDSYESDEEYGQSPVTQGSGLDRDETPVAGLWQPGASMSKPLSTGRAPLWSSTTKNSAQLPQVVDAQRTSIRRATKGTAEPLAIESRRLWEKPVNRRRFSTHGLWRPASSVAPKAQQVQQIEPASQKVSRPVTQRPPRRNKRVTALPDILESPKPLPDKRGTLGIFQFPWGEMSDTATVQPRPRMLMAMAGTMTSGRSDINVRAPEPEDYSTSFLDDYEDDDGDNFSDYDMDEFNYSDYDDDYENGEGEAQDEDDDFDEDTLWEIASLLKSNQVPSRDSLLPTNGAGAPHPELKVAYSYMYTAGDCSEVDVEESKRDSISLVAFPTPPRAAAAQLWTNRAPPADKALGLPQPDERTWTSYLPSGTDVVRAPPRSAEPALLSSSTSLWSHASIKNEGAQSSWLSPKEKGTPTLLWAPNAPAPLLNIGLPQPDQETWNLYLPPPPRQPARSSTRKTEPDTISSASLWSLQPTSAPPQQHALLWNAWKSRTAIETAMWTRRAPVEALSKGLPQPDAATWNAYLPPTHDAVRVQPRQFKPASIESTSLWVPAQSVAAPRGGLLWSLEPKKHNGPAMWSPSPPTKSVTYGLAQPEAHVWLRYVPSTHDALRVGSKKAEAASIESTQLWTKPAEAPAELAGPLWSAPQNVSSEKEEALPSAATTISMWSPPASVEVEEPTGLFSIHHKRTDFRTTVQEPATIETVRRVRVSEEPLPKLGSGWLWNQAPLWSAPVATGAEVSEGLFSLKHKRSTFRTTHQGPAALQTVRKLRVTEGPLPKLTSDSLWSLGTASTFTQDWISKSLKVARSPSVSSLSSDGESTATDSSSVKSDITRASTAGSMFPNAGAAMRKAALESPPPPVPQIRQVNGMRRPEFTEADWDAALEEAIKASPFPEAQPKANSAPKTGPARLWSKPQGSASSVPSADSMWQPSRAFPKSPATAGFTEQQTAPSRLPRGDKAGPDFSAQDLWRRTDSTAGDVKHWLHGSVQLQY